MATRIHNIVAIESFLALNIITTVLNVNRLFSCYSLLPFLLDRRLFGGSEKVDDGFLGALRHGSLGFSLCSFYFALLETVGHNLLCFCKWRRETVDVKVAGGALAKLEIVSMLHKPRDAHFFCWWGPKEEVD